MTVSRKQLSRWLDQWQELLQLQAWAVSLAGLRRKAVSKQGSLADVAIDHETHRAHIRVALDQSEADVRSSVCHECLHLAVSELEQAGLMAAEMLPAGPARKAMQRHVGYCAERLVHRLERAFAKLDLE